MSPASGYSSAPGRARPLRAPWPDLPPHHFTPNGTYILTAATLHHVRLFDTPTRLDLVRDTFLELAENSHLVLNAWAFLSNHYHVVASFETATVPRSAFLKTFHREIAARLNALDQNSRREVIHECWATELTQEKSWLTRLHFVNHNPVHHGVVTLATDYPWSSAAWFETNATFSFVKTVYAQKLERVNVPDDF